MKYFDTHSHVVKKFYEEGDVKQILDEAKKAGVEKILIPATSQEDANEIQAYASSNVLVAVGVHPDSANLGASDFMQSFDYSNVAAIGETGLDLYHEDNPPIEEQIVEFRKQIEIALKHDLPIIVHMRDAEEETYKVLSDPKYKGIRGVMHSFTATQEWADKFIALGFKISFSGIVTFKNARHLPEVAKSIPLNMIVSETDAPFLTPMPHRGKKNYPKYVTHTADFIASIRDEDDEAVLEALYNNAKDLFIK